MVCRGVSNIRPGGSGWAVYHDVGVDCERGAGTGTTHVGVASCIGGCNIVYSNDRGRSIATAKMDKYCDVLAGGEFDMSEYVKKDPSC